MTRAGAWRSENKGRNDWSCVGFWTPANEEAPQADLTGVQKAPRHEVTGVGPWPGSERYGDLILAPISMMNGMRA